MFTWWKCAKIVVVHIFTYFGIELPDFEFLPGEAEGQEQTNSSDWTGGKRIMLFWIVLI